MKRDPLSDWRVVMNCPASWRHMHGDERVRHCTHCDHKVYNLSEMTREEALALLEGSEGRVCARYYRRSDGTIMTRDCGWQAKTKAWVAARVGAALAALLGVVGLGSVLAPSPPSATTGVIVPRIESTPDPSRYEVVMGEVAAVPSLVWELRQEISFLNERIRMTKDRETRRRYADERQALVERLRRMQSGEGTGS